MLDDLKKLLTSTTLIRLDSILSPRLVPLLFLAGIVVILLQAVQNLLGSFYNVGSAFWGVLEFLIATPLWLFALRVICEAILVFFKAHGPAADAVVRSRASSNLLEDVRGAIHDLAGEDDDIAPATDPAPYNRTPPTL